jgi:hypothetical protein
MKKRIFPIVIILLATVSIVRAQDEPSKMETLFGDGITSYGGYGGLRVAYSSFDGKNLWLVGGRGGAIFNHKFVLGGAGYGIVNSPLYNDFNVDGVNYPKAYFEGGYGGVYVEYIMAPHKLVHLSFPLLVGGGGVFLSDTPTPNLENPNLNIIASDVIFVVEPGVEIELNVIRFMRFTAGVTYRYCSGLELPNIDSKAFNGFAATVSLKFGNF